MYLLHCTAVSIVCSSDSNCPSTRCASAAEFASRNTGAFTTKTVCLNHTLQRYFFIFFSLALQPQFGPWPTSMKLSVSLRFSRS
jgi:hypothetical protein